MYILLMIKISKYLQYKVPSNQDFTLDSKPSKRGKM